MKVTAHPFGQLASHWGQVEAGLAQGAAESLQVAMDEVLVPKLRQAVASDPDWPAALADQIEVFPWDGSLAVGMPAGSPEAEELEFGTESTAPRALFRAHTAMLSRDLSDRYGDTLTHWLAP